MLHLWWVPAGACALILLVAYFWHPRWKASRAACLLQAKRRFHVQRERLEAKFVQLAAAQAKPEAHRWQDCTFADDVAYVRSRSTGELSAFVAMTIAAEEFDSTSRGSADAVGNLQAGTAVFRFDRDHWETDGRAILNLSPGEAIRYYHADLEIVGEELAHRS
jgi:hypothetical protein